MLNEPEAIHAVSVDEPTVSMFFSVNNSPFAGREGKFLTSRQIRERLLRELESNVALRVEETVSPDTFEVRGRGELHLAILIETMRREGYELAVSKPRVIITERDGKRYEPVEYVVVDVPEEYSGAVIEALGRRRAAMSNMLAVGDSQRLEYTMPTRAIFGLRGELLTLTRGTAVSRTPTTTTSRGRANSPAGRSARSSQATPDERPAMRSWDSNSADDTSSAPASTSMKA